MVTRLYFHAIGNALANLPTTEQSSLTADVTGLQTVNHSMNTTIGTGQSNVGITSNATVSLQRHYFTRFVSPPLSGVSSITAQTWTYNFASREGNASANFPVNGASQVVRVVCYVWRPSNQTKVGNILDGNTAATVSELTLNRSHNPTFSGSLVSSVVDGDVICFEVWFELTQAAATAYNNVFFFDGTTVTAAEGTSVSNHATFIETPQNLTFGTEVLATRLYFHAATSSLSNLPTTTQGALTAAVSVDAASVNRDMDTTIGTSQTSLALSSLAQTAKQNQYYTRFVSDSLSGISSIPAGFGTYNFAISNSNLSGQFPVGSAFSPVRITCYVWRPSTQTKLGTIYEGNSSGQVYEPANVSTESPEWCDFTGSSVASISNGDVIIFEVWFEITQAAATSYTDTFFFDGTIVSYGDPNSQPAATSHAAFLEISQVLTFGAAANNYTATLPTETVSISEALARQIVVSRPLATETVTSSESLARQAINSRPLTAETIAVSESLTKQYVGNRALAFETITIGEASQRVITNSRALTETVPITESLTTVVTTGAVNYVRTLPTETVTVTEGLQRQLAASRPLAAETTTIGETLAKLVSLNRPLATETVTVGESIARTLNLSRALIASTTVTGVSLDGVNDYINCGDYSDLWSGSLTKFSFSLWLYNNGAITTSALILDHNSNNAQSFVVYNSTVGTAITFRIVQNNLTQVNCTASGLPSLVDRWVHVVGTYDSTLGTQNIKLYIDSVRTGNQPNLTETIASSGLLTLSGAVNDHKGLMKDFRFWNAKALTQTEVNDVYNSSGSAPTANYWIKLDEGTGSPVDFISASKTAILTNGATWQTSAAGEIVPVSESLQRVYGVVRALPTETVSIGETMARTFNGIRLIPTETVTVTAGTLARVYSAIRSLVPETTVISETLARLATNTRALATETIVVTSGTLARMLGASRQIAAQTVVISETIARLFTGQRLIATQTTAISDSVATLYTPAPPAGTFERQMPLENVAITESLNRVVTNARALSPETITASESLGRVYGVSRLLATQTTAISESLVRAYGSARTMPPEIVNVVDLSLSRLYAASRVIPAETVPITETINRAYSTVRALAIENVSISDSVARLVTTGANAFVRVLVETISIAESLARVFNGSRELVETVSISDHLEIPAAPVPVPLPLRVGPPKVETVTPKRQRRIAKDLQPYPEPRPPHVRTSDKDEGQVPETSMLNMMNGPVKNFFGNIIGMFRKKRDPDLNSNTNKVARNKLDKLERSLKKKLLAFYNSKIKGSPVPTDILRQQYDQQVKDIIRKAAQESYIIGTDQVANQVLSKDEGFQLFISTTDLNNIQGLTDRLSNDFWNTARRLQDREATVTDQGVKKVPFNAVAALTGIAAGLIFSAFNNAIKSKSTQVTQPINPVLDILATEQSLNLDIGFEVRPVGRVRFTTQHDSKVDPDICAPLDGTEWFVDDPSIVTPPTDTHPNCRCTLEPIIE